MHSIWPVLLIQLAHTSSREPSSASKSFVVSIIELNERSVLSDTARSSCTSISDFSCCSCSVSPGVDVAVSAVVSSALVL